MPTKFTIFIAHPEIIAAAFDRIKVFRSDTSDGVFVEVTEQGTRLPISASQYIYEYLDLAGDDTDYYKVSYFNTSTDVESSQSDAQIGGSDPAFDVLSVDELKSNYLFGFDLINSNGVAFPDSFFEFYIRGAVTYLERVLDTPLRMLVVVNEKADFIRQDYNKYIWLQLLNKPVISIEEVRLVLPTNSELIAYDNDWLQLDKPSGQLMIIPGSGALAAVSLGLSAMWLPILNGMTDFLPDVFRIDYTAGYLPGQVPYDIRELVGMTAAIGPLSVIGDIILGPGISGTSITLDSLMTNTKSTKDSMNSAFGARIREYRAEIRLRIAEIRRHIQGIRFVTA